jgi:hypothetical protein
MTIRPAIVIIICPVDRVADEGGGADVYKDHPRMQTRMHEWNPDVTKLGEWRYRFTGGSHHPGQSAVRVSYPCPEIHAGIPTFCAQS